ncbi:hypothetical protein ACJX0J_033105 [Zea mays]
MRNTHNVTNYWFINKVTNTTSSIENRIHVGQIELNIYFIIPQLLFVHASVAFLFPFEDLTYVESFGSDHVGLANEYVARVCNPEATKILKCVGHLSLCITHVNFLQQVA